MFDYKKNQVAIGYRINKSYWHRRIATDAVKLMVDYLTAEKTFRLYMLSFKKGPGNFIPNPLNAFDYIPNSPAKASPAFPFLPQPPSYPAVQRAPALPEQDILPSPAEASILRTAAASRRFSQKKMAGKDIKEPPVRLSAVRSYTEYPHISRHPYSL